MTPNEQPVLQVENEAERKVRIRTRGYQPEDFAPFQKFDRGGPQLPNFEEIAVAVAASQIASGSYLLAEPYGGKYARIDGAERPHWARYFYNITQGGHRDGTGIVLIYGDPFVNDARAGRFALCRHTKVMSPGANPMRGWHPGFCEHCGLNMTVDSGD